MLETVLDVWQEFMRFEYAHETLMGVGGLIAATAAFRIVKASFRLVFWVALLGLGSTAFSYGMSGGEQQLPFTDLTDITQIGNSLSLDALRLLCERM